MLICFIGMDGSGKTTLSRYFLEKLQKQGISSRYVHSLIWPRLLKPFLKIGRNLITTDKVDASGYKTFRKQKKQIFSKYPLLIPIYKSVLFADYAPQIFWKICRPLYIGEVVISDRYIYDTVIYMGLNLGYEVDKLSKEIHRWFRIIPKPDFTFLLDIDENIAFSRKDDVLSIEYLKERRCLYQELASKMNITILDGSKSIDELCDYLDDILISYL